MKSTLITTFLFAGLILSSCDYFESNDDNTYLNKVGDVKIVNETSVKIRFSISNPENVAVTGTIDSHSKSDIQLIPGFKWVQLINDATNDTLINELTKIGVQADKKHSLYFTSYSISKAATANLPARDSVVAQMALLDNFYSYNDSTIKVRVINANRSWDLSTVYVAKNGTDPLTEAPLFSNIGFATFDIAYTKLLAANYTVLVVKPDNSTIQSTFDMKAPNGYSVVIKQDGTLEAIQDN
jgi:hypothetical protein